MKHLIPILLLLAPLLAGAQESDTAEFIRPPYLHRGDTVGAVSVQMTMVSIKTSKIP